MAMSDSFGAGIFDDDFEEVTNEEVSLDNNKEQKDIPVEPVKEVKEEGKQEEETSEPTQQEEEKRPPRRRTRDGDRPSRGGPRPKGRRDSDRKDRGKRPRRESDGDRRTPVDIIHSGAPVANSSGVATGMGDAPAGTLIHQRVALLVDADRLDDEANSLFNARVSYRRIFSIAVRGRRAVRALAYMTEEEEGARAPFQDHLATSGFQLIRRVDPKGANWDVQLTLDAMAIAPKVDAVVIASSSPELSPLVGALKAQGIQVEVASFSNAHNNPLAAGANAFLSLSKNALYVP